MILLVEAGNSTIEWTWHTAIDATTVSRARYADFPDIDSLLRQAWSGLEQPERVVVSNVGGDALRTALDAWVTRHWQLDVEYIVAQASAFGIINAYPQPRTLGADRWAALVAARQLYTGNVCIVDAGTAITIDALSQEGEHLGGLIIPGIRMMHRAVADFTHIDTTAGEGPFPSAGQLASDTETAIAAGAFNTAIAVIDRTVQQLATEFSGNLQRVLTGGDAGGIAEYLHGQYDHNPTLVLTGVGIIAADSQMKTPAQ